ncbi:hypothetical protein HMPREF3232_00971 [Fannyhessea vaginae]|nr:hypothetical protein HMPREF3232_00971 [Fannyhessea vaginae]
MYKLSLLQAQSTHQSKACAGKHKTSCAQNKLTPVIPYLKIICKVEF